MAYRTRLCCLLFAGLLSAFAPLHAHGASDTPVIFTDGRFSGFDAIEYVRNRHSRLAERAESISHWSAYFRVNPLILSHLIDRRFDHDIPSNEAVKHFAESLSESMRESVESRMNRTEASSRLGAAFGLTAESAENLLRASAADLDAAGLSFPLAVVDPAPPALDLPYARPQVWQFAGAHTWTGEDDGSPMSSLDFTRTWGLAWGDITSNDWVSASHDGVVTVYSSCFVHIQHPGGWGTRYYHLDNLQLKTGDVVRAGDPVGNYANQKDQALCSGGHSTGPHLHFALLKDGQYFSLRDIELSGYKVHPGTSSYDSNHDRMWLEKRGARYYAFRLPIGIEEGDNTIDYRYNGMWYSPEHNGHGINVEITEFPVEGGTRKSVFVVVYTYDDSGLANFYVGNADYERWRSDEGMVIDMLQTSGGDFSNLSPIDFTNREEVMPAGQVEVGFDSCERGWVLLSLDERDTQLPVEHAVELFKLIGAPAHLCEQASVAPPLE